MNFIKRSYKKNKNITKMRNNSTKKRKNRTKKHKNINYKKIIGGGIDIKDHSLFTPYKTFLPLFLENQDKILMPREESGTHPLDKEAFADIKKKIEESYKDTDKTEQNVFLCFLKFLEDTIRYVPFNEYYEALERVSKEIKTKIIDNHQYQTIILCAVDDMSKSNFWVLLLCLKHFAGEILTAIEKGKKVYVCSNALSGYSSILRMMKDSDPEKVAMIYFDDMSYSGRQIKDSLPKNKYDTSKYNPNIDIFLCLSFISSTAEKLITSKTNNINIFEHTTKVESMSDQFIEWCNKNDRYIYTLFPDLFSGDDEIKQKMFKLLIDTIYIYICDAGNPEQKINDYIKEFSKRTDIPQPQMETIKSIARINSTKKMAFHCYESAIPIYFDHKIADAVSTYDKFLNLGTYPSNNEDCTLQRVITNCKGLPISEVVAKNKYKCNDGSYVDEEDSCLKTFYKDIKYTLNGESIDKNQNVNQLFS